ncbi:uncharacterized protein LOC141691589 [Apium graveolens]|uniref:uncharacterized protein LOC141691589 n=1 Tax=Apium graveolens TaxID=4045 RepID=UPI003D7BBCC8
MSSDRSWMSHRDNGRGGLSDEYKRDVDSFVEFAQRIKDSDGNILCPCNECKHLLWRTGDELKMHLYRFGIIESYTRWYYHGEKSDFHNHYSMRTNQNDEDDVYDAFKMLRDLGEEQNEIEDMEEEPNEKTSQFYNMLNQASVPLYPNHEKHSKLSFIMKLLHFKNRHHCSQKGFDELLELIGSVLPDKHTLPEKYSEVKNMVSGLNMGYEKIDACENDCMLFYKTDADKLKCDICGADKYKNMKDEKKKPIAKKILRVWPVFVVVYNFPPSMCMKDPFIFMPLIIPGDRDPTKDLNVYLRPLIDELKMLWNTGVTVFDKASHSNIVMKAALLWTISDFLAYGMISGWSTHGKMSCPVCVGDVKGFQLKYGGKPGYFGTSRIFLEPGDPLRKNNKYGARETRLVKTHYSGQEMKIRCQRVKFFPHGKKAWRKPVGFGVNHNWTHMSMFWELPYWEDNLKSRKDCKHLNIRKELWIRDDGTNPHAEYALTKEKVNKLCKWLEDLELPDGCSSNIVRCSKEKKGKFKGMKSHDGHVFLQKLLLIVPRDLLPKSVGEALIELCNFFKDLCSTSLKKRDLEKMEKDIIKILCKLDLIFTPGFFDTMEHLPVHLATECKLGGPVQYRWMYPFERYLGKLKLTIKNKARVEGSMVEPYVEEELVNFCSLYFEPGVPTIHNRLQRNEAPRQNHNPHLLEAYTYPTGTIGAEKKGL